MSTVPPAQATKRAYSSREHKNQLILTIALLTTWVFSVIFSLLTLHNIQLYVPHIYESSILWMYISLATGWCIPLIALLSTKKKILFGISAKVICRIAVAIQFIVVAADILFVIIPKYLQFLPGAVALYETYWIAGALLNEWIPFSICLLTLALLIAKDCLALLISSRSGSKNQSISDIYCNECETNISHNQSKKVNKKALMPGRKLGTKWTTISIGVASVIMLILLFVITPREDAYETAIADKIASEMIHGDELPLAYQYSNVVLDAIDFQVQDTDKSADTATVRFAYVDVLSLADMFAGSMNDPSLFYTYCIDQIDSGSAPTITRTISVSFEEFYSGEVKKLRAVDSLDLADVLTGGVASEYVFLQTSSVERNITKVVAGAYHNLALFSDGTVRSSGVSYHGEGQVEGWTGIVDISATDYVSVGLRKDGTVVVIGNDANGKYNVSDWDDIVAIASSSTNVIGVRQDGTVVATGNNDYGQCNTESWVDITQAAIGTTHAVGLKTDGTVVAIGDNEYGQCNVSDWTDIVCIKVAYLRTIGLKADGTVVATGGNFDGECNVSDWSDIIAIDTDGNHTVGLKSDGTVVATGFDTWESYDACNVGDWEDVVYVDVGFYRTIGLKTDGTIIIVGWNDQGQCDIQGLDTH